MGDRGAQGEVQRCLLCMGGGPGVTCVARGGALERVRCVRRGPGTRVWHGEGSHSAHVAQGGVPENVCHTRSSPIMRVSHEEGSGCVSFAEGGVPEQVCCRSCAGCPGVCVLHEEGSKSALGALVGPVHGPQDLSTAGCLSPWVSRTLGVPGLDPVLVSPQGTRELWVSPSCSMAPPSASSTATSPLATRRRLGEHQRAVMGLILPWGCATSPCDPPISVPVIPPGQEEPELPGHPAPAVSGGQAAELLRHLPPLHPPLLVRGPQLPPGHGHPGQGEGGTG